MSFKKPINADVTQKFGVDFKLADGRWFYQQVLGFLGHNGHDYAAPHGTAIYAADDGTVTYEGWGQNHSWMGQGAGICVLLNNGGIYSGYAHMSSTVVNKGQNVGKGQLLGYVGATGAATGAHLHFEAIPLSPNFKNGYVGRIDPQQFMEAATNNQGGNNVPVKITLDAARQLTHGILARNGLAGRIDALGGACDSDLIANHVGKDLTVEYLQGLFLSQEGRDWRDVDNDQSIPGINRRLSQPPKEIIVEKPVEVVKEVIKEVPVEKIKEVEVIKEVIKGDEDRSAGELLLAAFNKLFKLK